MRYTILVEKLSVEAVTGYGAPFALWEPRCSLRAEIVTDERAEAPAGSAGKRDRATMTVRTRAFDGITTRDRLTLKGAVFRVIEVKTEGAFNLLTCEAMQ